MDNANQEENKAVPDQVPSNKPRAGQSMSRITTGIRGLDTILSGGLIRSGIYIIMGAPGAGKTIMANQICFNHVAGGGRAVYVTLLAETHSRMLLNLQTLHFFNPAPVSDAITYLSGYGILKKDGLRGLTELIRKEIRHRKASLVVLDGLMTAMAVSDSELDFKSFIDQLHVYTEVNGCTTLLLSHRTNQDLQLYRPEYTMVDGIIELQDILQDERAVRELFVSKLRGSGYLRGRHSFTISDEGIVVFPRTEALLTQPSQPYTATTQRREFGVAGLDRMLTGRTATTETPQTSIGLLSNSITMLLGAPGTGKTTLGLAFLAAGAAQGQKGLHFGFHETPDQLRNLAEGLGFTNFSQGVENGLIQISWQPPLEEILDMLAERLLSIVRQQKIERLVIDSFQGFSQSVHPERLTRFFTALNNELRALNITTLLAVELRELTSPSTQVPISPVSTIFDNVIFLRHVELHSRLYHLISIIKERGSNFDPTLRQLIIGPKGLSIGNSLGDVEGTLTGIAHSPGQGVNPSQAAPPETEEDGLPRLDPSFEQ